MTATCGALPFPTTMSYLVNKYLGYYTGASGWVVPSTGPPNVTRARNAARVPVLADNGMPVSIMDIGMGMEGFGWYVCGHKNNTQGNVWCLDGHIELYKITDTFFEFRRFDWVVSE